MTMPTEQPLNSAQLIALEDKLGARNYKPLDVVLSRGEGVWVWDVEGNKYLDCLAAYSAVNQGHCHPAIIKALTDQASKMTLTSRAFRNDQLALFYKELCEMTDSKMVLPMNSGAEAVETVIKAVRKWGYVNKGVAENQAEIITAANNFHGRTITIVGFSTEEAYQDGFGPFTPGFKSTPFGDLEAVKAAITPNTVAIMLEPIQGEGGIIIPPKDYLKGVRELCDENNIILVLDEIQTGLGRTGKMFASEHDGVAADMVLIGKALSGGVYPISAVLDRKDVLAVFNPGDHGSTYGGNPLACAVARAALKVLKDEKLIENAEKLGAYCLDKISNIQSPYVKDVRGRGLMIGIELTKDAGGARRFCEALMADGMLCKETHETIIRLAPPLVITKDECDWMIAKVEKVLTTL